MSIVLCPKTFTEDSSFHSYNHPMPEVRLLLQMREPGLWKLGDSTPPHTQPPAVSQVEFRSVDSILGREGSSVLPTDPVKWVQAGLAFHMGIFHVRFLPEELEGLEFPSAGQLRGG